MTAITVVSRTQKIIVDPSSSGVAVINQGPAGPAGPGAFAPTAWTAVTFQNGWSNFGGGFQEMQYRRNGDLIELRGVIKSGTVNVAAFTLPSGFRPPATSQFSIVVSDGATLFADSLRVYTSGECVPTRPSASVASSINCSFSTV